MNRYARKKSAVNNASITGFWAPRLGIQNNSDMTSAANQLRRKISRRIKNMKKLAAHWRTTKKPGTKSLPGFHEFLPGSKWSAGPTGAWAVCQGQPPRKVAVVREPLKR